MEKRACLARLEQLVCALNIITDKRKRSTVFTLLLPSVDNAYTTAPSSSNKDYKTVVEKFI